MVGMFVMMEHIVLVVRVDRHILQHIQKKQHIKRRLQAILQAILQATPHKYHPQNKIFNQIQ
nr:MAG TPA: hypothetical protein [Caudoviricetes sp.]